MALVTTAGASNANSYADTTFADAYFLATGRATEWAAVAQPEGQLLQVMRSLENQKFIGSRATVEQALEFPRIGVYQRQPGTIATAPTVGSWTDKSGRVWANDVVPDPIKQAQCEDALAKGSSGTVWTSDLYKRQIIQNKDGLIELNTKADLGSTSSAALDLLAPFLSGGGRGVGRSMRN